MNKGTELSTLSIGHSIIGSLGRRNQEGDIEATLDLGYLKFDLQRCASSAKLSLRNPPETCAVLKWDYAQWAFDPVNCKEPRGFICERDL